MTPGGDSPRMMDSRVPLLEAEDFVALTRVAGRAGATWNAIVEVPTCSGWPVSRT